MEVRVRPPPQTAWERWREIASYPFLWLGLYVLWIGFVVGIVFVFLPLGGTGLRIGLILAAGALPILLFGVSHLTLKAYDNPTDPG